MTFVACSVLIDSSRSKGLRLRLTNDSKVAATKWESVGLRCLFFLSALPSWLLACMCWRGWLKLMMTACNGRGKHKAKGQRTVVFLPSVVKDQIHCHRCEVQSVRLNRWMIGVVLFVVRCGSSKKIIWPRKRQTATPFFMLEQPFPRTRRRARAICFGYKLE